MDVCEAEWSSDGSDGSDCSLDSRLVELDFDATRPKPLGSPTASVSIARIEKPPFYASFAVPANSAHPRVAS